MGSDKQALWSLLSLSFSKKLDFLSALVFPSQFRDTAQIFDEIVLEFLECATGLSVPRLALDVQGNVAVPLADFQHIPFQHHIVHLPISKGGVGLRPLKFTHQAAYIGGLELALPFFTGENGLCCSLEDLIGRPDVDAGEGRWSGLLSGTSRTGRELATSWDSLTASGREMCDYLDTEMTGPLALDAEHSGEGATDGSTRSKVVQCLESLRVQSIQHTLQNHPDKNARPVRFFDQRDKVSQAWLTALPGPLTHIPSIEFTQAMAWLFMLPSPACAPFVGSSVC